MPRNGDSAASTNSYLRTSKTYARLLPRSKAGRRYFLRFEGASIKATVRIDDRPVGSHLGAFTAFAFEVTDFLKADREVRLEVDVDNRLDETTQPLSADFSVYGGLYRRVSLIETPPVCIDPVTDGADGVSLDVNTNGTVVATIRILGSAPETQTFRIPHPKLWSPETPRVYELKVTARSGSSEDSVVLPVGFRDVKFTQDGFSLNGRRRVIRGVNRHQDWDGKGWAITKADERTDVGWIRRLAGSTANALERVRAYVERGEGESASYSGLSAKFGRAKFFSKDFFPYALYYLGLMTFESAFRLQIPNLTIRNMFVDYYDELSAFTNEDVARRHFIGAAEDLVTNGGTWANVFEQFWQHYVKARIPAQAFDKMNENFFRTTFASRCMDAMPFFYSVWSEFNVSSGRIDFLASPKPGTNLRACLIEFKYMNCAEADRTHLLGKDHPEPEDVRQTMEYLDSLVQDPNWTHGREVEVVIVEVAGNRGYNWFEVQGES